MDKQIEKLAYGGHKSPDEGLCLLEACACIAGEPHSDHPKCVDPVLATFGRSINDAMNDDERVMLLPLVTKLVGTAGDHTLSLRRSMLLVDGLVRQILPQIFDNIGIKDHAETLRKLERITDEETASAAYRAARSAADSAARSAADSAARSAARSAASAASAAYSAADSAAYSAAYSAADSAARKQMWSQMIDLFAAAIEVK